MTDQKPKGGPAQYLREATHELRQVQWPTRQRAIRVSIITIIFVIISTFIIYVADSLIFWFFSLFS